MWIKYVVWWFVSVLRKSMLKSAITMHSFLSFEILPSKSLNCMLDVFIPVSCGL